MRSVIRASKLMLAMAVFVDAPLVAQASHDPGFASVEDRCYEPTGVSVRSGWWIDAVQLVCAQQWLPQRGGNGGGQQFFQLQPGERLERIDVTTDGPAGPYVYALQFHTNFRSSPRFGEGGPQRGTQSYQYSVPQGARWTGFRTRSGTYLEAIAPTFASERVGYGGRYEHHGHRGSFGRPQPALWDQGAFDDTCDEIAEVQVRSGWWVDAVQVVCRDGAYERRGGEGGGLSVFRLWPGEYITGLSGRQGGPAGDYVYALQIHTNRRSSPVFGEGGPERGYRPFSYAVPQGQQRVGLSGRAGQYLEQIHITPQQTAAVCQGHGCGDHQPDGGCGTRSERVTYGRHDADARYRPARY